MIHADYGNSKDITDRTLAAQRAATKEVEYQRRIDNALADAETDAYLEQKIARDEYMAVRESMYGAW